MASVVLPVDKNGISAVPNLAFAAALGCVPGFTQFRKFGVNSSVAATNTLEDVWAGSAAVRVLPTSAGVASVVSNSESDNGTGASGAIKCVVEGLDASYAVVSEEVTLGGPSAVVTSQIFFRVNRAYLTSAGVTATNIGTITVTVDGNEQAAIKPNRGQTEQTNYTVPSNTTLAIMGYQVQVGRMAGSTDMNVLGQIRLVDTNAWRAITNIYLWDGAGWANDSTTTLVPAKTELRVQTDSSSATQITAVYQGVLIDNDYLVKGIYL